MAVDHHVGMEQTIVAHHHIFADNAVRTDPAIGADLCFWMNNGSGVNHRDQVLSTNMNVTSASLTTRPFTEQTPLAFPIFPRVLVSSTSIKSVSPGRTGLLHFTLSADMK